MVLAVLCLVVAVFLISLQKVPSSDSGEVFIFYSGEYDREAVVSMLGRAANVYGYLFTSAEEAREEYLKSLGSNGPRYLYDAVISNEYPLPESYEIILIANYDSAEVITLLSKIENITSEEPADIRIRWDRGNYKDYFGQEGKSSPTALQKLENWIRAW